MQLKTIFVLMLISIVLISGCTVPQDQQKLKIEKTTDTDLTSQVESDQQKTETPSEQTKTVPSDKETKSSEDLSTSEPLKFSGNVLAGTSSPFIEFNSPDFQLALESDKLIILSFYANWCPICKAEEPELFAGFNELETDNVVGFRVNFNDDQTDFEEQKLAEDYQVPYQHTRVFIKNKEIVLKTPESWTKERLLEEINKYLE